MTDGTCYVVIIQIAMFIKFEEIYKLLMGTPNTSRISMYVKERKLWRCEGCCGRTNDKDLRIEMNDEFRKQRLQASNWTQVYYISDFVL
ncbi:hypothetical protein WN51_07686 [Melipona quadrifasciata]|uniref:Uncharacterized protein n=1 Tax=Melipona quadrifasciata TaxID=166423 RepID=A0A0M9A6K4_9HYME|nr:hypothetical protein WN51_07686 [Melipona quadrifasciata]